MPTGLKRSYGNDHLHFLTCSCYHRQPWLASSRRRDLLLQILEAVRQRYGFVVVGYVAMPDHIHLLISEPERGTPSTAGGPSFRAFCERVGRSCSQQFEMPTLCKQRKGWATRQLPVCSMG